MKNRLCFLAFLLVGFQVIADSAIARDNLKEVSDSEVRLIVAQASNKPSQQLKEGSSLFNSRRYTDAVSAFSRVIANPKSTRKQKNQALINRSQAYLIIGQPALSLRDIKSTVYKANQTKRIGTRDLILGTVYIQLKQYKLAVQALTSAIRYLPNESSAYSNRAVAYQFSNNLNAAANDLRKSLAIDPTPSTVFNLAILEKQKGNFQRCYYLLSKIEETEAAYADVFLQKGICAKKIGKPDQALKDFIKAASINKFNPLVLENIGLLLYEKGDKKSAIKYLEKAGELYLERGDIENYSKVADKAAELSQ